MRWAALRISALRGGGLLLLGCATTNESVVRDHFAERQHTLAGGAVSATPVQAAHHGMERRFKPESLKGYTAQALRQSPRLRAAFERWRASVLAISKARRLPDPTITLAYFLRSVETKVGPQLARFSVRQSFPWPSKLSAGADAASANARAGEQQLDAEALSVAQRVADHYWQLWLVRRTRVVHEQHLLVLKGLSESVLARVAVGKATLAVVQQVALASARTGDMLSALDEKETSISALLASEIGESRRKVLPTPDEPPDPLVPAETDDALHLSAAQHPLVSTFKLKAAGQLGRAQVEEASAYPSFSVGADWIMIGKADGSSPPDNGKDALMVGAGMSLPLWQASYSESAASARASALQYEAESRGAADRAHARVELSLSRVRDARRRALLYRNTLIPLAEAALSSALGAFVTGRGAVADTLLLQKDLLQIRIQLERARADHARSWAQLEEVTGRTVLAKTAVLSTPSAATSEASVSGANASTPLKASAAVPSVPAADPTIPSAARSSR